MLTPFQQQKLGKMFDLYDANKDGHIEEADYLRVAEGFARGTGTRPGSAEHDQLRAAYLGFWNRLRQVSDADKDGKVTRDEFIASYDTMLAMRDSIVGVAQSILHLTDRDHDGKISRAEFAANLQAYGVAERDAGEAFGHLDRDGDGYLTIGELLLNVEEFFYGEDPHAPGNWLVGPL
jgi:Ca2+-binding EF-hand superfamily protein